MKKGLCAIILAFAVIAAASCLAEDVYEEQQLPTTVANRLSVEFHAVTGTDSVVIDLPRLFGKKADFVASKTVHTNVTIDPISGIALISSLDPEWRGTEEVVFATAPEYLEAPEQKGKKRYVPRYPRNLTIFNATKDKIALISDAFTQAQFDTILGNLTAEPVIIVSHLTNDSMMLEINDEVTINLSMGADRTSPLPKIDLGLKAGEENLSPADYKQPKYMLYFTLAILGVILLIIGGLYFHYTFGGAIRETLFAPKSKASPAARFSEYKKAIAPRLASIRRRIGKEKAIKLYRETLLLMNKFLSRALKVSGSDPGAMDLKLSHYGLGSGTKAKISAYFTEYRDKAYTQTDITNDDVHSLLSYIESILRGL